MGIISKGADIAEALEEVQAAGAEAFDSALGMCGNNGQIAIIEGMADAFEDAAMEAFIHGSDAASTLNGAADHDDAVSQILDEVGGDINDAANEARQQAGIDGADELDD